MAGTEIPKEINIIRQVFTMFDEYVELHKITETSEMLNIYFNVKSYDNIDPDIDMDVQFYFEMKAKIFKHLEIISKEILYDRLKSHVCLISPTETLEYIYDEKTNIMETKTTKKIHYFY